MFNKPCHTHTHTEKRGGVGQTHTRGKASHRNQVEDNNSKQFEQPLPPTLGTECNRTRTRTKRHRTWHVEPQKPQNSIRKPLECGNSNAGFAPVWPDWTTGPQDVHVFGYTAKPIIFSCYICISKKSNGTNPNFSTKDEHKFKNISV